MLRVFSASYVAFCVRCGNFQHVKAIFWAYSLKVRLDKETHISLLASFLYVLQWQKIEAKTAATRDKLPDGRQTRTRPLPRSLGAERRFQRKQFFTRIFLFFTRGDWPAWPVAIRRNTASYSAAKPIFPPEPSRDWIILDHSFQILSVGFAQHFQIPFSVRLPQVQIEFVVPPTGFLLRRH